MNSLPRKPEPSGAAPVLQPEMPPVGTGTPVATPEGDNEFAPEQPLEPIDASRQKPPAIDTNSL